jgi:hypothetical protein
MAYCSLLILLNAELSSFSLPYPIAVRSLLNAGRLNSESVQPSGALSVFFFHILPPFLLLT